MGTNIKVSKCLNCIVAADIPNFGSNYTFMSVNTYMHTGMHALQGSVSESASI